MGNERAAGSRWRFPRAKGIVIREETGEWSDNAFFSDLLDPNDQAPEVWYQPQPADDVNNAEAWGRWLTFLQTRADAGDVLRRLAVTEARQRLHMLRQHQRE